jgi:hypothetical protein
MSTSPGWLKSKVHSKGVRQSLSPSPKGQLPGQSLHSCSCCSITIEPPGKSLEPFTLRVELSKKNADRAIQNECPFAKWCMSEAADAGKQAPLQFSVHFTMKDGNQHDIVEAEFRFHRHSGPSLIVCADRGMWILA